MSVRTPLQTKFVCRKGTQTLLGQFVQRTVTHGRRVKDTHERVTYREDDLVRMTRSSRLDDGSSKETLAEMFATVVVGSFS
jgi:hypothetical protein